MTTWEARIEHFGRAGEMMWSEVSEDRFRDIATESPATDRHHNESRRRTITGDQKISQECGSADENHFGTADRGETPCDRRAMPVDPQRAGWLGKTKEQKIVYAVIVRQKPIRTHDQSEDREGEHRRYQCPPDSGISQQRYPTSVCNVFPVLAFEHYLNLLAAN